MARVWLIAACALVLGAGLLLVAEFREAAGLGEFAELRASMVGRGGVVFVRNAEDCGATAGPVELVAAELQKRGVVVRGVILERGPVDAAVQSASEAFPHESMSVEATAALAALGHVETPLALVVDSVGAIVKLEQVNGRALASLFNSLNPR